MIPTHSRMVSRTPHLCRYRRNRSHTGCRFPPPSSTGWPLPYCGCCNRKWLGSCRLCGMHSLSGWTDRLLGSAPRMALGMFHQCMNIHYSTYCWRTIRLLPRMAPRRFRLCKCRRHSMCQPRCTAAPQCSRPARLGLSGCSNNPLQGNGCLDSMTDCRCSSRLWRRRMWIGQL